VFVSGLSDSISEDYVKEVFSKFGEVIDILFSKNHKNSKRKDLAFVTYSSNSEAKRAVDQCKISNYFDPPVTINLSFSPQAMHSKKKSKEQRRRSGFKSNDQGHLHQNPPSTTNSSLQITNLQNSGLLSNLIRSMGTNKVKRTIYIE
jgi:RNA recognition motif-containing protein